MLKTGRTVAALAILFGGAAFSHIEVNAQSLPDYTSYPMFISDAAAPNILFVYDTSSSMNEAAYAGQTFSNSDVYEGIFDPTECYEYDGTASTFAPDSATANGANPPSTCPSGYPWSGNLLNFTSMRRVDIAKWALIGGQCVTGGRNSQGKCTTQLTVVSSNASNESVDVGSSAAQNLMPDSLRSGDPVRFSIRSNGVLRVDSTDHTIKVDLITPASGILQDVGHTARLGLMPFSSIDGDGSELVADIGTAPAAIVDVLDPITNPGGVGTPLAESLYEAVRYLAQVAPHYNSNHFPYTSQNRDPYYFVAPDWAAASTYVACCKSYIIILTDGESNDDTTIPAALQGLADGIGGTSGSEYLDDVSYWAHTTDLRDGAIAGINESGKDLPGIQDVTIYTFFAFGSGSSLLQTAAKFGGFRDLNGNNEPDLQDEWDQSDNLTGAATPDGIPDNYFESTNAADIKNQMLATINSILQRSGSGGAASVLASSSTGEGAVYQSFFYPSTVEGLQDIKWTGHTQALFIDVFGNLREDSNSDGKLVYEDDMILRMTFDTASDQVLVERYADTSPADGLADSTTPVGGAMELRHVKGIWEAGKQLALMDPANRNLDTWIDKDHDGVVDSGEQIAFATANVSDLKPYLRPGSAPFTEDNIIEFIRGEQPVGLRNRRLTVDGNPKVWKMGDPIHAQPVVVGPPAQRYDLIYGDSSYTAFLSQYKDRRQVAYVGANDGMLHAFNGGFYHRGDDPSTTAIEHGWFTRTPTDNSGGPFLGEELFGFIPQELLPHLIWLTRPDYTHVSYVDLTPKVTEARIFPSDADHPNGWGTILMGGFRFGGSCGSCPAGNGTPMTVNDDFNYDGDASDAGDTRAFYSAYFVLDVTNPESSDYPKLLWSFSTADLGFSTTTPSMLRVSPASGGITDNTDAKWYMLVGSGPTGYDGRTTQSGTLYAIDLAQGPGANNGLVTTLNADSVDAFLADPVTVDRDFDYRVDAAYMGGTFFDGSLPWRGKLYRMTMNACSTAPCTPAAWGIADGSDRQATELLDTFPSSGAVELGPVTAAASVAIDDSGKLWVFAGTGRYFDAIDKSSTAQQHFVGVKDKVMSGCAESTRINCHANDLVDVSSAQICLLGTGNCGGTTNQVTGVSGASDFPSLIALVASKDGWYTALPGSGERALSKPLAIGGLVLFPTFKPTSGTCGSQGESNLYALYYLTGSAYSSPVIGTNTSGGETYVQRSVSLGSGMSSQAVVHIGEGGGQGKAKAFIQKSTAEMVDLDIRTAGMPVVSRFITWHNARR